VLGRINLVGIRHPKTALIRCQNAASVDCHRQGLQNGDSTMIKSGFKLQTLKLFASGPDIFNRADQIESLLGKIIKLTRKNMLKPLIGASNFTYVAGHTREDIRPRKRAERDFLESCGPGSR